MFLQRVKNRGIRLGTIFDRAAQRHPANFVVLDHDLDIAPDLGRRFSLTELASLVDDFASRLWAARVRPGDRVVVHKSDGFDITVLAVAAARVGATAALLSPKLDGATVAELLRRTERPHLVTDQDKLTRHLPAEVFDLTEGVLLTSGTHEGATPLSTYAGCPRVRPVEMSPDHPVLITHTSGTTGIPKLAVHTNRTFQARYRPQATVAALIPGREPVAVHMSFVHSRLFTAMPIAILQGHPLVVLRDDEPESVAELFARVRPGVVETHPNTLMRWEVLADDRRAPLANVKYFSSTFDAVHPRTVATMLRASRRRRPRYAQIYGQSEVGPVAARTYAKQHTDYDGRCVGAPFPGMTGVRVVSRDGRPVTKSNPGFIEVRSDGRILTYLGEHARWRKQVNDGWWRMGDLGYRTRLGCLHLLDREVDHIEGVDSTLELEDRLLARLPDLVEVIIVPDQNGVPVPVVCTRDDQPLDEVAWKAAVVDLPKLGAPVQWHHQDLPQTATTKIKRLELGRLLSTGPAERTVS